LTAFGLIGYPLTHSFSGMYFAEKFKKEGIKDCTFQLFPLEQISKLPDLIEKTSDLKGLTVTIPYKEKVIEYLDEIDPLAEKIGAVNTINILPSKNGGRVLKGHNTDVHGFHGSLQPLLRSFHTKAIVLGTGGASKAVASALEQLQISTLTVSRDPAPSQIGYDDLTTEILGDHLIIINCTPLGMFPNNNTYPKIPYKDITNQHLLYDLNYNPEKTLFLQQGKARGATIKKWP